MPRILVVEDSPTQAKCLSLVLEGEGFAVDVAANGGAVTAHSGGIGKGATFTVCLPLEPEPAALSPSSEAPPHLVKGKLRLVVIEDNKDAADSLCMLLRLRGHEVRAAYTGTDGLALALEFVPDALISDIGLPGLDGYGVARGLRQNPATARALLLAVTGYGSPEDRRLSQQAGFDHHLTEPVAPEALLELLAN